MRPFSAPNFSVRGMDMLPKTVENARAVRAAMGRGISERLSGNSPTDL